MSYTPINSDATAVSAYTIARLQATVPASGAAASDQSIAIADSYLGSIGYQGQSVAMSTASNTSSTSYADVGGWSSYSFTAAVAKVYLVIVSVGVYLSASAAGGGTVYIQLVNTTTSTTYAPADNMIFAVTLNDTRYKSLFIPVTMAAGANSMKLQWKVNVGTTTANTDAASTAKNFTVLG